jgi:hypothetical protein
MRFPRVQQLVLGAYLFSPLATLADANSNIVISGACKASADPAACATAKPLLGAGGFLTNIINVLIFAVGAISVIMIIIGGLRYALSGGDSAGIKSAKDTILYALVGVVVAVLSYAIVQFVIGKVG